MKRWLDILERWWREVLLVVLFAMPAITLSVLGILWLHERDALLLWLGALLVLTLFAIGLSQLWRRPKIALAMAATDAEAGSAERRAREHIAAIAATASGDDIAQWDSAWTMAGRIIDGVAAAYHPGMRNATLRFTIPEGLLLAERLASRIRLALLDEVPALRDVKLSLAVGVQESLGPVQNVWRGYRALRFLFNPVGAALAEARGLVIDHVGGPMIRVALNHAAAVVVREIGEAAILLYSGRLRADARQVAEAASRDTRPLAFEPPPGPITILVAGQVKAGKSTLINALSGRERALISPLPATAGFAAYALDDETAGALRLIDSQGLADLPGRNFLTEIAGCDLILWVAAAHRADRAIDQAALKAIFAWFDAHPADRRPPVILVLTQADRLSPAAEWSPPYDLQAGKRPKETHIRNALAAARTALGLDSERAVAIALPGAGGPWNLRGPGSLWEAIHAALPAAHQKRLERLIGARHWWDQLADVGTSLAGVVNQVVKRLPR